MSQRPTFKFKDVIYRPDTCELLADAAQAGKIQLQTILSENV